ncbi:hypothetical protein ES288_A11G323500v1 [Gossypium darwinii]|uniref:ABC-type xenobiotic transporter n=1 Tax=Gossypium darwinii TaxID=34276 RepID=A0A5D2ER44_GOSDA|nr:hypothetical protein ES288_A11G323500v1 [Gossypium darwinii]
MSSATSFDFLLKPIFLHGFSASLHLVLLLLLLILWVVSRVKKVSREGSKERQVLWYKRTLACCFVVSVSNVVLCLLSCFYWYTNGWSEDKTVSLIDYALKTLAWGAACVYLHCQFSNPGEQKRFPIVLRIWWGFYFSISCYCLVIDIVLFKKHVSFPSQYLVSDVLSVVTGLFLCIVGFFEPLLNGDSSVSNGVELSKEKGGDTETPYSNAGIFSILTFSWMGPLIAGGNKKPLDLEDVPQLDSHDSVIGAFPKFKNRLESADSEGNGVTSLKLVKALFFSTWKEILWTALFAFMYTVASYIGPYLIDTFAEGYLLVAAFFVAKLVECLSERRWFFKLQQVGLRQRAVLSKQSHTSGEIINFMIVDTERVGAFCWYMHDPWMVVLQTLRLGSIVTFIATVLKFQDKLMESKDTRMKATSEILRNMRFLKLQGWEMKFLSKIVGLRSVEEGWLKRFVYTNAMTAFVFCVAPSFVSAATFGACRFLGVPLESGKILYALATFRILQEPIYNLPDTISMIAQTKVSLDRIAAFLRLDDLQPGAIEKLPSGSSDTAIEIADGNFSWDMSSPTATLKDINLKVSHGMSVSVCGTVSSGKSSLLSCVLGEFPKISGTLKLCGTTAYVAQSPWIQSGKIVDNILFGKEMDRDKYDEVLEACTLKKDLEILSFGDQTVIGERGINLSGGQKQRIQIARALYQDADIYLFDDPFSAVDAHTGSHLFMEVLLKNLRSKTVIYVTHQVEFLPAADLILVMKDGRIVQAGKYNDILNSGTDFMELVGAYKKALSALDTVEASSVLERTTSEGECDIGTTNGKVQKEENQGNESGKVDDVGPKGQLVQEEEREKGQVGFSVYWKYIITIIYTLPTLLEQHITTAYGGALVPLILLSQILFEIFQIGSNYWMTWGSPMSAEIKPPVGSFTLIMVYLALAIASAICVFARSVLLGTAGYKTATLLFKKMHLCIFRAPMSFFDSTPSGRILNRASTNQSEVDMDIAHQVATFAFSVIQPLGIIAVMSQVSWQIFIIFIPVIATCIWYQQYYISSARELSRLVGVCQAPVIQNFAETILGATTIRSFDQETRFQDTNMALTDSYSRPKFYVVGAMEWLSFRLDLLSSLLILETIAGLAVTYGLNLNILQAWVVWTMCNMENKIISVERILQYCSIPSEPTLVVETNRPDHVWPYHGEVRYAPHMPLVLRGLTCTFPGGLKTSIVGRTGSGKLTLIQTLFRIVEPAAGQIIIDGVNISSIGLHDLRSQLSIIPQEPTMFEGTIRSNLDPLEEYTDEQIWEALDKCQLGDGVRNKAGRLDSSDSILLSYNTNDENGENWSMGQRQLVCLGRVLLKKSKILVLDEATASVDTATNNLIQTTLREHFSDCTVITITHQITSVLDSDMVLLLSHG